MIFQCKRLQSANQVIKYINSCMPKLTRTTFSIYRRTVQTPSVGNLIAERHNDRKRKMISKPKNVRNSTNQKQDEECAQAFQELISMMNQQFIKAAHLFNKKQEKLFQTPLPHDKHLSELPTIHEKCKLLEDQDESSKKEKEETQIQACPEKVF